jgi:hypothetical protein
MARLERAFSRRKGPSVVMATGPLCITHCVLISEIAERLAAANAARPGRLQAGLLLARCRHALSATCGIRCSHFPTAAISSLQGMIVSLGLRRWEVARHPGPRRHGGTRKSDAGNTEDIRWNRGTQRQDSGHARCLDRPSRAAAGGHGGSQAGRRARRRSQRATDVAWPAFPPVYRSPARLVSLTLKGRTGSPRRCAAPRRTP